MKDILPSLEAWRARGEEIALATVIETWGSAPRPVGSKMAVTRSGEIAGSVSAGCVEGAVIEESQHVLKSSLPRLLEYGVADDTAFEVGLACGGNIKILVEPFTAMRSVYDAARQSIKASIPAAVIAVISGPEEWINHKLLIHADGRIEGDLALGEQQALVVEAAISALNDGAGRTLELPDGARLFIDAYPPTPHLIVVGAVHIAEALVPMAGLAGFDTTVVDPRAAFASAERFPTATHLVREWPGKAIQEMALNPWTYVAVLTHDPKLDDPALMVALRSGARYVGALGSRRTNRLRLERLRKAGLSEAELERLHAPVGLALGGRAPSEVAVSILAEIIQVKNESQSKPDDGPG